MPVDGKLLSGFVIGLVVAGGAMVVGGPLQPPAGPVAPTYKTLDEVEPRTALSQATTPGDATALFRITEPGSYYRPADTSVPGPIGIRVDSDDVTIDLMGFTPLGPGGAGSSAIQLEPGGSADRLTLRNGALLGFQNGVALADDSSALGTVWADDLIVEDVRIATVASSGIGVDAGDRVVVRHCVVTGGSGVEARSFAVVADNTIEAGGTLGVRVGRAGRVERNTVRITQAFTDGIDLSDTNTRVDSNNVVGQGRFGIVSVNGLNLVVRNSVGVNFTTEYSLPPFVKFGPLVTGVGDLGSVPGGDNPWANFIF